MKDQIRIGEYVYVKVNSRVYYGEVIGCQEVESFGEVERRYLVRTNRLFRKYIEVTEDEIYREE